MNCPKCNAPLGANDTFCLKCGQKIDRPAAPYGAYAAPAAAAPAAAAAAPAKKANPLDKIKGKKLIPIIAIVAVVIVVAIILFSVLNSPKTAAKNYLEDYLNGNFEDLIKYEVIDAKVEKKAIKDLVKAANTTEEEYYDELCDNINDREPEDEASFSDYDGWKKYQADLNKKSYDEFMEDNYGTYEIKVEIVDVETISKDMGAMLGAEFIDAEVYDEEDSKRTDIKFDSDNASKYVMVDYHFTIEGTEGDFDSRKRSGDSDSDSVLDGLEDAPYTMILAKINGKWKVLDNGLSFDGHMPYPTDD